MTALAASERHQDPVAPRVAPASDINRCGNAPREASPRTSSRTFARYAALLRLQGACKCAPYNSFRAMIGVAQPVTFPAASASRPTLAATVPEPAGCAGVPTVSLNDHSQQP